MKWLYWLVWITTGKCCSECGGGKHSRRMIPGGNTFEDSKWGRVRITEHIRCANNYHND